jgi:hypothetical protein
LFGHLCQANVLVSHVSSEWSQSGLAAVKVKKEIETDKDWWGNRIVEIGLATRENPSLKEQLCGF